MKEGHPPGHGGAPLVAVGFYLIRPASAKQKKKQC
jgi:hypothetical protein